MMPSKTATTDITFRGRQHKNQQQQKARQGAVTSRNECIGSSHRETRSKAIVSN
jgi:hypothetical protein